MHALDQKNKYIGIFFMKISKDYFALGREGIHKISAEHAQDMAEFSDRLTHVVCTGVDGRYDQMTIIEADTLEEIHSAATAFKMGSKARYIDMVDVVVGMKARNRGRRPDEIPG